MILLRNRCFSKKTDEETEKQRKGRRSLATLMGVTAGGTSALIADSVISRKINDIEGKVYGQATEHLTKLYLKKRQIDRKIDSKAKELLNDPKIKKEGKMGIAKVNTVANRLKNENASRSLKKIESIDAATERLLKRIRKRGTKVKTAVGLGSAILSGVGAGIATSNTIKKNNKKINRIRRHI